MINFLEFLFTLNLNGESSQIEQDPQVNGQLALTPFSLHLASVCLLATQVQSLVIRFPSFRTFILSGESLHVGEVGVTTGEAVGDFTGAIVTSPFGAMEIGDKVSGVGVGDGGVPHEHFPSSGKSRGAQCCPFEHGSQALIPLKLHESVQGLFSRPLTEEAEKKEAQSKN